MELSIDPDYVRIVEKCKDELRIVVLSTSVLQAWQTLHQERSIYYVGGLKQQSVTCVDKEIEKKKSTVFLLFFKQCTHSQKGDVWLQTLSYLPDNYLNLPINPDI